MPKTYTVQEKMFFHFNISHSIEEEWIKVHFRWFHKSVIGCPIPKYQESCIHWLDQILLLTILTKVIFTYNCIWTGVVHTHIPSPVPYL